MKYKKHGFDNTLLTMIPENEGDIEFLKEKFPHLYNYNSFTEAYIRCISCGKYYTLQDKHKCSWAGGGE